MRVQSTTPEINSAERPAPITIGSAGSEEVGAGTARLDVIGYLTGAGRVVGVGRAVIRVGRGVGADVAGSGGGTGSGGVWAMEGMRP